jgi:hypothetical protein
LRTLATFGTLHDIKHLAQNPIIIIIIKDLTTTTTTPTAKKSFVFNTPKCSRRFATFGTLLGTLQNRA